MQKAGKQKDARDKNNIFVWAIVLLAIGTFFFFGQSIISLLNPTIDHIRFGEYILKKSFLVTVAFGILIYWSWPINNFLKLPKKNKIRIAIIIAIIAASLLFAHFLSFGRWFDIEAIRIFGFRQGPDLRYVESPDYTMMIFYLVLGLFGTNFLLYNGLGLFMLFLSALSIFWLLNRIQKNTTISLLASLFFTTTTAYFQNMITTPEFIGDPFALLLFILSTYLLINKFYPGSVIFAAAALEYGVTRTNFIALPLLVTGILFTIKKTKVTFSQIACFAAFLLISLHYPSNLSLGPSSFLDNLKVPIGELLLRYFTMVFALIIPHEFISGFIHIFQLFFGSSSNIAPLLGILITILMFVMLFIIYKNKKVLAAKVYFLGMTIFFFSILIPTIVGRIRLEQVIGHLTSQFVNNTASGYTNYGVFPAFGVSLLLAGIALFFKSRRINTVLIVIIILNIITSIYLETQAVQVAKPEKKMISQLIYLLLPDGKQKFIFIPENSRPLYGAVQHFYYVFYPLTNDIIQDSPKSFIQLINTNSPLPNQMYFFSNNASYKICDFSSQLRKIPREKLSNGLENLIINSDGGC